MINLRKIFVFVAFTVVLTQYNYAQKNNSDESSKIITLSTSIYQDEIKTGLVLVDYWATWCGPCKKMEPVLEEISKVQGVKVAKLNVDNYKSFTASQNIRSIPTMILYKNGKEVQRLVGVYTKSELLEILNSYL